MSEDTKRALRNLRELEQEGFVVTTEIMSDGKYLVLMKPLGFEEEFDNKGDKTHVFCLMRDRIHAPTNGSYT
jgi:hypothetical protein